ncbi:MAG: hypothetical protein ACO3RV_07535, partial [Luteolibacter sp.]
MKYPIASDTRFSTRILKAGLACIGLMMPAMAQTTILETQAGGGALPDGWTEENNVASNSIDKGSYWLVESGSPGDYIITNDLDLSSIGSIEINVNVATYGSGTANPLLIEYSTDSGATWNANTFTTATPSSSTYITGGPITITDSFSATSRLRFSCAGSSGRGVRIRALGITGTSNETDTTAPLLEATIPAN